MLYFHLLSLLLYLINGGFFNNRRDNWSCLISPQGIHHRLPTGWTEVQTYSNQLSKVTNETHIVFSCCEWLHVNNVCSELETLCQQVKQKRGVNISIVHKSRCPSFHVVNYSNPKQIAIVNTSIQVISNCSWYVKYCFLPQISGISTHSCHILAKTINIVQNSNHWIYASIRIWISWAQFEPFFKCVKVLFVNGVWKFTCNYICNKGGHCADGWSGLLQRNLEMINLILYMFEDGVLNSRILTKCSLYMKSQQENNQLGPIRLIRPTSNHN